MVRRVWDNTKRQAMTRFLVMPVCNDSTAEALFTAVLSESRDIPWNNMIGYASDTASVMVGVRNSVLSRIKQKQLNVFSLVVSSCHALCCSCIKKVTCVNG